jgi:hypothetical protein
MRADIKTENEDTGLVGVERCRELVFPDPDSRPCRRIWDEWRAKGLLPYRKVGRRVFMEPAEARRAIDRQFKIETRTY